jgi:HAE1 family hydrophobic/amphiphilic exporter-1
LPRGLTDHVKVLHQPADRGHRYLDPNGHCGGCGPASSSHAQFPEISDPQIQVVANYTGADAITVAQSVATPIEQQMAGVDGMNYMSSQNASNGQMALTVDFGIDTVTNTDQILSQMRVLQANAQLPSAVLNNGVTVQKSTSSPLMLIDLSSSNSDFNNIFLANYAFINLNDELTRVPGVASVSIFGAGQYAMRCWVDPDKLANLGVTVPEIVNAIRSQNTVNPAGQIGGEPVPPGQQFTYTVRAPGRLPSAEAFGEHYRPGT